MGHDQVRMSFPHELWEILIETPASGNLWLDQTTTGLWLFVTINQLHRGTLPTAICSTQIGSEKTNCFITQKGTDGFTFPVRCQRTSWFSETSTQQANVQVSSVSSLCPPLVAAKSISLVSLGFLQLAVEWASTTKLRGPLCCIPLTGALV